MPRPSPAARPLPADDLLTLEGDRAAGLPAAICVVEDGRIAASNAAFASLLGLPGPELLTGRSACGLTFAPADAAWCRGTLTGPSAVTLRAADGGLRSTLCYATGNPDRVWALFVDLTEQQDRWRATTTRNAMLGMEQAIWAAVFDALPAGVLLLDGGGRVTALNAHCRALLAEVGLRNEEHWRGRPFAELCRQAGLCTQLPESDAVLSGILAGETGPCEREFRVSLSDQERWHRLHLVPLAPAGFDGAIALHLDVTPLHRIHDMLARQAEKLEAANHELQHYTYVASHHLQEPLRLITSYVQLLARRYSDRLDDDARDFIAYAADAAKRMAALIQDLVCYSTLDSHFKPVAVDLNRVLTAALDTLRPQISASAAQVTQGMLPVIRGDEAQLLSLFRNLLANAVKFRQADRAPFVTVSAQRTGPLWRISVTDNGIGIEPEYHEIVFGLFQRLHPPGRYDGTGVGLAIARRVVDHHGGRIWIESRPGTGTAVHLTLPAEH